MPQTEAFSLSRFVSLLKNVRAVAFLDPNAPLPREELKWLTKKYRYRSVGVSSRLLRSLPENLRTVFEKKPYVELSAPLAEIETLSDLISHHRSDVPSYVFDSIVMASCYVNPLLIIGRESYDVLKELTVWTLSSSSELPDVEIKRNTRIIGYAILDFHEQTTTEVYENLQNAILNLSKRKETALGMVRKIVEKRRKLAQKDGEHRFWRLREKGKLKERVVVAYVDIVPIIAQAFSEVAETGLKKTHAFRLVSHIRESGADIAMALSLVPAFILELAEG
jgi:hypothetical protein